ncbi:MULTISPECIES: rod shape-determining protein MreD [unclassified Paenibacillus]|uniref:rod shape-determining protein MreD n=1 Tax=unclassified Paenibacillus TaxID=185978 RepID=UPI002F3EDBB5
MSMNRIVVLMFFVFILEGALMPWLIPAGFGDRIIPHFVFVFVLYAALYGNRHQALLLGAGFGLLQDIVYFGHLIGAHTFLMGLIGYFTGVLFAARKATLMMAVAVVGLACLLYDSTLLFIYKVFKISNADYAWALLNHILPSLFLQLVFMLLCYIPLRKMFQSTQKIQTEDDEE